MGFGSLAIGYKLGKKSGGKKGGGGKKKDKSPWMQRIAALIMDDSPKKALPDAELAPIFAQIRAEAEGSDARAANDMRARTRETGGPALEAALTQLSTGTAAAVGGQIADTQMENYARGAEMREATIDNMLNYQQQKNQNKALKMQRDAALQSRRDAKKAGSWKAALKSVGFQAGGMALGTAIGGPVGGAVGGQLGSAAAGATAPQPSGQMVMPPVGGVGSPMMGPPAPAPAPAAPAQLNWRKRMINRNPAPTRFTGFGPSRI